MKIFNIYINKKYIKTFLILGWISIWFSLSFNPEKLLLSENFYLNNLFELMDFLRGFAQLVYFIFLLIISIIMIKKIKKKYFIFFLLLFFFLIQFFSLILSENPLINVYYLICSFNVILTCFLFVELMTDKEIYFIFKISIFILMGLIIFFGGSYIISSIIDSTNVYGAWGSLENDMVEIPRPTGLSRSALIILIYFAIINFFNTNKNFSHSLIIIYSSALILLLSSRTSIFVFVIYILFYTFYFKLYNEKYIFEPFKNFLFYPFLLILALSIIQNSFENKNKINGLEILEGKNIFRDFQAYKKHSNTDFTSGRLNDWKSILNKNQKRVYGNGVLGDRYLIEQSASNLLIYSYASSGLIGVLLIIYISLNVLFQSLKCIIKNKDKKILNYKIISALILIFLMLRSILETSYGIFGIDFLMFCLCYTTLLPKKTNK